MRTSVVLLAPLLLLGHMLTTVNGLVFAFTNRELIFVEELQRQFFANSANKGFVDNGNGVAVQVLGPQTFLFLEGPIRFELEFEVRTNAADLDGPVDIAAKVKNILADYFSEVILGNTNANTVLDDLLAVDNDNLVTFTQNNNRNFAAEDLQIRLVALAGVTEPTIGLSGAVFCVTDTQCLGARADSSKNKVLARVCSDDDGTGITTCNEFVAFFTIRWLLGWFIIAYLVLILWALYWTYPYIKKKLCKAGGGRGERDNKKGGYSDQEQLIINTLAAQCASAENLLFQATDMLKQAQSMENIMAVEAKREAKIMIYTVQYFQAVASMLVALSHQYLDRKTNKPGERWNVEDATTRALQLEVLNYVRDRLQLAFNSDAMTEKSLFRIAEAYAILKKITDAMVLVGFQIDKTVENSLGNLKTPVIELTEDAVFLGGLYRPNMQVPGADAFVNQPVCITIEGANKRDMPAMSSGLFLANVQRDSKMYDPKYQMTEEGRGRALAFSTMNQAQNGEGLQFFVRTFWGNEISVIQSEAQRWLTTDGALETFLDNERREREARASPVVKRGHKKKRDKKHKKKKNKDGKRKDYAEDDETGTEVTEFTEASGWSVDANNNYVFNVQSVINQGLGIAGKPGMPYDKPGERPIQHGSKFYMWFQVHFPNYAEWPKFYTLIFVIIPIIIAIPMLSRVRDGAGSIDIDGNVNFKARVAGFGTSYLGVPNYYFLDGFIPDENDLVVPTAAIDLDNLALVQEALGQQTNPFGVENKFIISQTDAATMFEFDFDGASGRKPEDFIAEVQAGILAQQNLEALDAVRNQQLAQEVTTVFIYALMHNAGYFFGLIPLTLVRESLEILARRMPFIREIYPMSLWRDLHMAMGLCGILYVALGGTLFAITAIVGIGKHTPFSGNAGDPNIARFFVMQDNVLYIRQLLLPAVPLLLLMKYAARGPPAWMRKYAPTIITKNYWEICYFLHYAVALAAIIILVIYRPQVFYWMGATWGIVWGGNKIVRILRTRKTTIKNVNLVSYTVEDKRNNAKKRTDVLRITLNVPSSFPSSARGQACWLTCPSVDYVAHPFTLAKVPSETDKSIMFHIGVKYLEGDDIISYARPEEPVAKQTAVVAAPQVAADPNALPPGWKSAIDPGSGQTYYYNSQEKRTTWNKPKSNTVDKLFDGVRGITTRMSANILNRAGSSRFGAVASLKSDRVGQDTAKVFTQTARATWTQKFAQMAYRLQTMDPDLRRNAVKNVPVYVSAPLGTSMDDALMPHLPGSIIITTQNGLPAAESSVRWLLKQDKTKRPKFHFFVSVSREVNDALSVVETLRDSMCESVLAGHLDIDGLNGRHAHMVDWLGIYIHLTQRKPSTIEGDRDMLLRSLSPPAAQVSEQQLEIINNYIKNRVMPGRLPFDRFLARTQQMVRKRTGVDNMSVAYCGSAKVAYSIRASCRGLERVKFDGEFI